MAAGGYLTAGEIINRAALSAGLARVADPFASTDPAFVQLCGLLTEAGQELVLEHEWPQLLVETELVTVGSQADYDLPDDFLKMIPQSGWNRSTRFPLGGPLSVQEWQYLKAAVVGVTFNVLFRITPTKCRLFPTPSSSSVNIYYEYLSRNWVLLASDGTTTADAPVASADTVHFEPILIQQLLKLKFQQAKGFDTTASLAEYQITLDKIKGMQDGAPRLNLNGNRIRDRFLDGLNIPITGLGGQGTV
jgi:hypothetical protein